MSLSLKMTDAAELVSDGGEHATQCLTIDLGAGEFGIMIVAESPAMIRALQNALTRAVAELMGKPGSTYSAN